MFTLSSDITIGAFRFRSVNNVTISRSMHGIVESAKIHLPSIGKIIRNGKADPSTIITGKQFKVGDPVIIKLGYNGGLQTEFKGFVKKQDLKTPLEVECEGYSWQLRRSKIHEMSGSVTLKELLDNAVSGIPDPYKISVRCEADITLKNVSFKDESGFDVISDISSYTDDGVFCFFIKPDVLWCGFVYTDCEKGENPLKTPLTRFRIGYNVTRENELKERMVDEAPVQVTYNSRADDGNITSGLSDIFKQYAYTHNRTLTQIRELATLKVLAIEKANRLNYNGYEGYLHSFLQPFCEPGYMAAISDSRYPERDGTYLVESVHTSFGVNGAKRKLEIGIRLNSDK